MDLSHFSDLVDKYNNKLFRLAYHMLGSKEDAEDAVQETFLQAYRHLDEFRGDSSMYTWLYRITINTCLRLQKVRKQKYVADVEAELSHLIPSNQVADYGNPEDTVLVGELVKKIRTECHTIVMHKLPEKQRLVFVMRVVLDLSYQEITEILGISENVVKSRLHRARERLLSHFQHNCEWYTNGEPSSCCQKKVGWMLAQDTEALKRVQEKIRGFETEKASNTTDLSPKECNRLEDIYRQLNVTSPDPEIIKDYVMKRYG